MNRLAAMRRYWDDLADAYQAQTTIGTHDFHYGPLLPGDSDLRLLPTPPSTAPRALEVGCGAGQNSIFLARQGWDCTALDLSPAQLAHGRALAAEAGVTIDWREASFTDLPADLRDFDLIHSTYALPFTPEPAPVIADLAARLRPGGTLLLTVGHPLYAGEWVEDDAAGPGLFLPDYFRPEPDRRLSETGEAIACHYFPVAHWVDWLLAAGLTLDALREPEPLPIPLLTSAQTARIPYLSADWLELYPVLACVPTVLILRATRP